MTARIVGGLFFPQRIPLKLDGHGYSPLVFEQIVTAGASVKSYEAAALLLEKLAEVDVSPRHVNNLTTMAGRELAEATQRRTEAYQERPLSRKPTTPTTPIALASVSCDGGRMQTRRPDAGPGVHDAHWRETKNAGFFRMKTRSYDVDPHPRLPRCYANREHMSHLLDGVPEENKPDATAPQGEALSTNASPKKWRPEVLFRTCLSALCDSESFGPMMAAEADARGLFAAERRAFLGDGQQYNWTIQKKFFPTFVPVLDFIHPLEYLYETAKAIHREVETAWTAFQIWAEQIWQGGVRDVLTELRETLARLLRLDTFTHSTRIGHARAFELTAIRETYESRTADNVPIPNAQSAFIPPEKLTQYLLNVTHLVGSPKARWFMSLGYHPESPDQLGGDLLEIVRKSSGYVDEVTEFGVKYTVRGWLESPNGSRANVRSVWITETDIPHPRFVTAYPDEKSENE